MILGVWVALLPYLGFTYSLKDGLETLSGIALVYISYIFYKEYKKGEVGKKSTFENFKENKFETEEK